MANWNRKSEKPDLYQPYKPQQNIKLTLVTGPTLSIVSRSEAKNYIKIGTDTTDDSLVDDLIDAATRIIESEAGGIAICEQTWKQTQTGGTDVIKLMRQPVIGVPTVSYYDDFTTVTATNITYSSYFRVVQPNVLVHVDGYFEEGREQDGYEVMFKAGMFTASTYTNSADQRLQIFKTAILRTIAWMYENREEYVNFVGEGKLQVTYDNKELPLGIKRLIMPVHSGEGLI